MNKTLQANIHKEFDKQFSNGVINGIEGSKNYGKKELDGGIRKVNRSELLSWIDEITKQVYLEAKKEAVEAERKQSYKRGYNDGDKSGRVHGKLVGAVEERARLESLIPEKRKMEDCHCLYSEGCGCGVRDFNECRDIMQEAFKK